MAFAGIDSEAERANLIAYLDSVWFYYTDLQFIYLNVLLYSLIFNVKSYKLNLSFKFFSILSVFHTIIKMAS